MQLADRLAHRFTAPVPLFLAPDKDALKLELKPYLQPFEKVLALRELSALMGPSGEVVQKYGYYLAYTNRPEELFRERLTYWQRVGRFELVPTLQKTLEYTQNGVKEFAEGETLHNARRLRFGPHDLHEYRGKFFPQLVSSLINISSVSEDGIVLDPMCGSGTSACETIAAGRSALAADLNPLSVLITKVKAGVVQEEAETFRGATTKYLASFQMTHLDTLEGTWLEDDVEYLRRWFSERALQELASLAESISRIRKPLYRNFFRVCLSNIVRSVSWQKEIDLRVRKEVRPYDAGIAFERFSSEVTAQTNRIYPYLGVLPPRPDKQILEVRHGNAVDIASVFPEYRGRVGLLVTSPPYATALPYLDTDRLSLIVLGLLTRSRHKDVEASMVGTREISERERAEGWESFQSRKRELPGDVTRLIESIAAHNHGPNVGFRRRNLPALLGRYFVEMLDAMRSARRLMRKGARGYYVVGNNSSTVDGQKIEIPTDRFLFEIGVAAGWKQDELISMELLASRDIFKENRGSAETILCFKAS